jgi:hypothetical protein
MFAMRAYLCLAVSLLVCCVGLHAEGTRHDGNWWHQQSAGFRLLYILGFMDGMDLGSRFSTPDTVDAVEARRDAVPEARRLYRNRTERYFTDVTVGQISDGLDAFFRDYKNRSITLTDAFEIVLRSIKGEDVEKLIQARRSSAAGK